MRVAFIGLGVMGYPMAGHLSQAGFDVAVYNRDNTKAQRWHEQYGGRVGSTPASAAEGAKLIMMCVGNDDDVRSVSYGDDGILAGMQAGSILIDHTTVSAGLARELEQACIMQNAGFLDAPVSGGQAGAENGQLTIMVGGEEATFDEAMPVLASYARCVRLLGASGSGQLAKMVNQVCIAGVVQGLAEALHFAESAGLNAAAVVEVISQGAAQSWQMENRYQTMLAGEYEHGFAVDWMRKDLAIVLEEASRLGLDLQLTQLVDGFYGDVQAMGGGRWDTSSLLARLKR